MNWRIQFTDRPTIHYDVYTEEEQGTPEGAPHWSQKQEAHVQESTDQSQKPTREKGLTPQTSIRDNRSHKGQARPHKGSKAAKNIRSPRSPWEAAEKL